MPSKPRQRRNQREVSVHTEHSQVEFAANIQGQDPPQLPPSDPNRELKEKDAGMKTLPQNEGGNQEKPHQDSGSHEKEATFVTMSDQPYPEKYVVPTFSRFDGRKGSALVHISKFIDSMGAYAGNGDLCLREFSKSLDDRAYTWYTTLLPGSVKAHLENLDISRFAQLLQKARKTALSVKPHAEKPKEKKSQPQVLTVSTVSNKRKKSSERSFEEPPPPVPCTLEEMMAILNKWVADGVVKLPEVSKKVTEEDKKNPKFCYFHQYVHHSTADCWTFRRKFHEKIQDGTLELPQAKQRVHTDPFLKHKDRAIVSVVIHGSASDVDMDEPVAANSAMTPAAIKTLQRNPSRAFLETTNAITFTDEDMEVQYLDHRRPLYLSATINEVQVRRALVDTGSCINFIPLSTIQAAKISQKKIQGAPMEIKGFGGVGEYTKGHIQLVLKVGPIVALTRFHVVDSVVPYHILLGRPWLHKHQLIPSTYHQCVKGRLNGKPIRIAANSTPFDQSESHFVEAALYDEITPAGEASLAKPIGIPLPKWEEIKDTLEADLRDLLERKKKRRVEASTSKSQPQCVHVRLPDGSHYLPLIKNLQTQQKLLQQTPNFLRKKNLRIDPKLVAHSLNVEPGIRPVVQPMRTFHPEVETQITQEVKKLLSASFIKPIQHPRWLSNIVPVKKKNGQIRCCVDFRNLNKACLKDEFPLPNMDLLIDSVAGHAMFSFMDGFSSYNQIFMSLRDAEKTTFRTPIGNFYYTIMPFGLKNAGATYQRTMTAMFHDMMHREIEDYVDDIVMNPLKCAFGVSAGKFLGFLVHQRGIDVDPARASAIATMKPPTTHKELKSFLGKLSYIRRFISGLAAVTSAFAPLLKKGAPFHWSTECQEAFEKVQNIMTKLPTVCAPIFGKPLRLYLASNSQAIGALIAQKDDNGVEQPIYYVSCTLKDAESRYSGAERSCLALIYASQRLRHYFLAHKLSQYEIIAETPIAIKSQAIADLLAQFPGEDNSFISDEVPEEINEVFLAGLADSVWTLRFDGSSTATSAGAGIVLQKGDGEAVTKSFKFDFLCSNNAAEYEAYLAGLAIAYEMGIKHLALAQKLEAKFNTFEIEHAQRNENRYADALATLGSQITFEGEEMDVTIYLREIKDYTLISGDLYRRLLGGVLARCIGIEEAKEKLPEVHEKTCGDGGTISLYHRLQRLGYFWLNMRAEATERTPFLEYLLEGILPSNSKDVYRLKMLALSKMVFDYGNDWKAHLADVLWAYRSSHKTATGFTPFSLVYGIDTISPTELVVPSPRVMQGNELEVDTNMCVEARMADLEGLDEARDLAKAKAKETTKR
uniref:Reverse transcriptase n=1 Tax=Fagus sylvatica TaxID=28930 RepID=A0A2N9J5Q0_FAGSY